MLQLQYKKQNKAELLNSGKIVEIIIPEKRERKKCTMWTKNSKLKNIYMNND